MYITPKEVKRRWGHGQEDIFPVTQFEKLWVDMTALPEIESRFVVSRLRGQQLKDQPQLDAGFGTAPPVTSNSFVKGINGSAELRVLSQYPFGGQPLFG